MNALQPQPSDAGWSIVNLAARLLLAEVDAPLIDSLFVAQGGLVDEAGDLPFVLLDRDLLGLRRETALDELAAEFSRLFVGPDPVCPPYASINDCGVLLGGRHAREIEAVMEELALELPSEWRIAASDHLGVELSVFAALDARRRSGTIDPSFCVEFFARVLSPWAPSYLRRVALSARWAPYRTVPVAAAMVLDSWVPSQFAFGALHS
ncbi:MAG: TorD/DmsD family molecular chaperone [Myxococcota bacterium]